MVDNFSFASCIFNNKVDDRLAMILMFFFVRGLFRHGRAAARLMAQYALRQKLCARRAYAFESYYWEAEPHISGELPSSELWAYMVGR